MKIDSDLLISESTNIGILKFIEDTCLVSDDRRMKLYQGASYIYAHSLSEYDVSQDVLMYAKAFIIDRNLNVMTFCRFHIFDPDILGVESKDYLHYLMGQVSPYYCEDINKLSIDEIMKERLLLIDDYYIDDSVVGRGVEIDLFKLIFENYEANVLFAPSIREAVAKKINQIKKALGSDKFLKKTHELYVWKE